MILLSCGTMSAMDILDRSLTHDEVSIRQAVIIEVYSTGGDPLHLLGERAIQPGACKFAQCSSCHLLDAVRLSGNDQ